MKKFLKKIFKTLGRFFKKTFRIIYRIIDLLIVTPLSKLVYKLGDLLGSKNGNFDKILNNPTTLLYASLICALVAFFAVDLKVVNLTETEALVLSNMEINVDYNEEAYVVEGIPESADIVLMGKKSSLYLAEQLGDHKLSLDLTGYSEGTHKVNIKYNNPINTLDYKLDPSRVTIVIHPKISETRTLTTDVLNQDKLNEKLTISSVELSKSEVIIKSYKEKLTTVANVKALVDANALNATSAGTYTLDNVKLVAYDENGTEINDIEIVPGTVTATVVVSSPSKVVPINVVPVGDVASGSAISSITPNVSTVTLYGDENVLKGIEKIDVEINVDNLSSDKTFQDKITKPNGVRSMSETAITIKVVMEKETSVQFDDIPITFKGLDTSKYNAQAASADNTKVSVVVKGVKTILNKLSKNDIVASIDLSDLPAGTWEVPVNVTGSDNKLTYTSKTTKVKIIIIEK